MLTIHCDVKLECTSSIKCKLTLVATVVIVGRNTHDVTAVNFLPIEQVRNADRAWPVRVVLIYSRNLYFLLVISIDQQIVVNVN